MNTTPLPQKTLAAIFSIGISLLACSDAFAGMAFNPITFKVKEAATYRAEALSFFIVLTLILAFVLKVLWNAVAKDFSRLPRLTYWRSLGLIALWGLFIAIIMSMTTGARALMTPGAWERSGAQYQLTDPKQELLSRRKAKLETLKTALMDYANAHNGKFPGNTGELGLPLEAWQCAHPAGAQFHYIPLHKVSDSTTAVLVLYEPDVFDDDRFCMLSDGQILKLDNSELIHKLFPPNP